MTLEIKHDLKGSILDIGGGDDIRDEELVQRVRDHE